MKIVLYVVIYKMLTLGETGLGISSVQSLSRVRLFVTPWTAACQACPLQYSCLENPMDRGTWRATVHGVAKESDTTEDAHMAKYKILFGLSIIE